MKNGNCIKSLFSKKFNWYVVRALKEKVLQYLRKVTVNPSSMQSKVLITLYCRCKFDICILDEIESFRVVFRAFQTIKPVANVNPV